MIERVEFAIYVRGFERARGRFHETGGAWERGFQSLLEAVTWAGSIRERLRATSDPGLECPELEGLYWVRNLMLHVGGDALVNAIVSHGTVLGSWVLGLGQLGMEDTSEWRWRPRVELPQPRSPAGAEEYDSHLGGHVVTDTLTNVAAFLDGT